MNVAQAFTVTQEAEFLETLRVASLRLGDAFAVLCALLPSDAAANDAPTLFGKTLDRAVHIDAGDPVAPVIEAVKQLLKQATDFARDPTCAVELRVDIKTRSTRLSQATRKLAQACSSLIDGAAQGTARSSSEYKAIVSELLAAAIDVAQLFDAERSEPVRLALIVSSGAPVRDLLLHRC